MEKAAGEIHLLLFLLLLSPTPLSPLFPFHLLLPSDQEEEEEVGSRRGKDEGSVGEENESGCV